MCPAKTSSGPEINSLHNFPNLPICYDCFSCSDLFCSGWERILRLFRSQRDLLVENLALRQQLGVFKRRNRRPKLALLDKLFWASHGLSDLAPLSLNGSQRLNCTRNPPRGGLLKEREPTGVRSLESNVCSLRFYLGKIHAAQQNMKAWVGAQVILTRINFHKREPSRPFSVRFV